MARNVPLNHQVWSRLDSYEWGSIKARISDQIEKMTVTAKLFSDSKDLRQGRFIFRIPHGVLFQKYEFQVNLNLSIQLHAHYERNNNKVTQFD